MLASETFARSGRLSAFLRFVVEETIKDRGDCLKEHVIAAELYGKRLGFDPANDPAVRIDARRLRDRLREYYQSEGADDSIRIEIPKGAYAAQFLPLIPRMIPAKSAPEESAPAIAVLPLESFSDDPEQEYLADGLTDGIITELAKLGAPRVISRTSVMRYKELRQPLAEIAWELGVTHILEGSVIRWEGNIRITCQLIRVCPEGHLWAESYERELGDVLGVLAEIAFAVVKHMCPATTVLVTHTPGIISPRAYESYLKGRYHCSRLTPQDLRKSAEYFQAVLRQHPTYAPAYAGLAEVWLWLADQGVIPNRMAHPKARAAAQRALEFDPNLAEAWTALASVAAWYDWDWERAEDSFVRAVDLNPNCSTGHMQYGFFLAQAGRFNEAIRENRIAQALDPLSIVTEGYYGEHIYLARRFEDAVEHLRDSICLDPGCLMAHFFIGLAYARLGRLSEAIEAFSTARSLAPGFPLAVSLLSYAYARANQRDKALERLGELHALAAVGHVSAFCFALAAHGFGERDKAIEYLENAYQEREWLMCLLGAEPFFDDLREHPGFVSLVKRMNLPLATAPPAYLKTRDVEHGITPSNFRRSYAQSM
jgi:serine/threonine-protein kinase